MEAGWEESKSVFKQLAFSCLADCHQLTVKAALNYWETRLFSWLFGGSRISPMFLTGLVPCRQPLIPKVVEACLMGDYCHQNVRPLITQAIELWATNPLLISVSCTKGQPSAAYAVEGGTCLGSCHTQLSSMSGWWSAESKRGSLPSALVALVCLVYDWLKNSPLLRLHNMLYCYQNNIFPLLLPCHCKKGGRR